MSRARILVVEGDATVARDLEGRLSRLGYSVVAICSDAEEALEKIRSSPVDLVFINVPLEGKVTGIEAARKMGEQFKLPTIHFASHSDGKVFSANRISKPFSLFDNHLIELHIEVALQTHALEQENERLRKNLNEAVSKVKILSGLLSICSNCKKIRDQKGYWTRFEVYIENHSEATFAHGICPQCRQGLQNEVDLQLQQDRTANRRPRV